MTPVPSTATDRLHTGELAGVTVAGSRLGSLRLGTRRSALALAQSRWVASRLRENGASVELVEVTTAGDRSEEPLTVIGGTGVFASALRQRLLDGDIDLAVHSLKDLPTGPAEGIALAAVPERADVREALVARSCFGLHQLPRNARIGTGSPRRAAQLRRLRRDVDVVAVRGNVDTRLSMVSNGVVDAIVLAAAGLGRLGRADEIAELFDTELMLPAAGQGALAVECRSDDAAIAAELQIVLDNRDARTEVTAERSLLRVLEAGCTAPIGALARVAEGNVRLIAEVVSPDGAQAIRLSRTAPVAAADKVGADLASDLLAAGASGLIGENK